MELLHHRLEATVTTGDNSHPSEEKTLAIEGDEAAGLARLRVNCSWFQYLRICSLFVSNTFIVPWRFSYDDSSQVYKIISPPYQKVLWAFTHCLGFIVMRFRVIEGFEYVQTATDRFRYFDLMSLLGMYSFSIASDIFWWSKIRRIREFVEELQDSPLLKVGSQRSLRKSSVLFLIFICYCIAVVFFVCTCWGMASWDFREFIRTLESALETIFGIEEGQGWKQSSWVYFPLLAFSLVINFQNAMMMHFNDMLSISTIILLYNINVDLRRAIRDGSFSDHQVLDFIDAHKRLTIKYNLAFGLANNMYSLYGSPYYAIHIIDILNLPGSMDRFINAVYLSCLAWTLWAGMEINKMVKQHKKWMWRSNRMLKVEYRKLAVFLDDLEWERFGPGSFFVLDNGMAGQVLSLIVTLAVITIQIR